MAAPELAPSVAAAYRRALQALAQADMPFLVGGAFGLQHLTGFRRATKDLDLFVRQKDYGAVSAVLAEAGFDTDLTYPHWLGKAWRDDARIDVIFNSGNGVAEVDDAWFEHAQAGEVLGVPVRLVPPEESIWSKAFVMERERYDGADVIHLLRACAAELDWTRLLARFGANWRVLLAHLVLFGYAYPDERAAVPLPLLDLLLHRLRDEARTPPAQGHLCAGTLLSREQYLQAIEGEGYEDARATSASSMTAGDLAHWTAAIEGRSDG